MTEHRKGNLSPNSTEVQQLQEFDTKLSQLEIKVRNLKQLKISLFKSIDSLVHHYLMPAQSDEDIASIDIFNIPEACKDDPIHIVCNIGDVIGYPMTPNKIRGVYRDKVKRKNTDAALKARTLVVQFYNVKLKWDFMRAYRTHITILFDVDTAERHLFRKRFNHLRLKHVVSPQAGAELLPFELNSYIFVDDHLGPYLRRLFMQVSNYCQKVSVPMVWVNNSKIYVRRGKNQPAIRIKKFNQIVMIKSLANKYTNVRNVSGHRGGTRKWFAKWNAKKGYNIPKGVS